MSFTFRRLAVALAVLTISSGAALAQKVSVAVGGASCLCYLPTVLAKQLGEYDKAGLSVELVDLKGGSDALKAVLGGSAVLSFFAYLIVLDFAEYWRHRFQHRFAWWWELHALHHPRG